MTVIVVSVLSRLSLRINIELDIRGARDADIKFMNCAREEVISIARSMI